MEQILIDSVVKGIGITTGAIVAILIGVASLLGALAVWYTLKYIAIVVREKVEKKRRG